MRYQVYGVPNHQAITWHITENIQIDLSFWNNTGIKELVVLVDDFSIGNALELVACLDRGDKLSSKINPTFETRTTKPGFDFFLSEYIEFKGKLAPYLAGKELLLVELEQLLIDTKLAAFCSSGQLSNALQTGYLLKEIELQAGVTASRNYKNMVKLKDLKCNRCGSDKITITNCSTCEATCATCEECITIGRAKTCTPLIYFRTASFVEVNYLKQSALDINLTSLQEEIANDTIKFITERSSKELLIWAVTGAGKTEMIFPAIYYALKNGLRVLVASPRKDVIKELSPRFKQAFPNTEVVTLYGGSEEKWHFGTLYLATTHQVIRFKKYFDLAFIDEIDAYPYHNNQLLEGLVTRALNKAGQLVYMTATPPRKWLKKMKKKEIAHVLLPVRFHQEPLPMPNVEMIPRKYSLLKREKPYPLITSFIKRVKELNGQAFVFLPEVKQIPIWTKKFKEWFPKERIAGVFAADPKRDLKVQLFRENKIQFLLTTTIMERGVTVPNAHIMVIGAEAKIFDEATLVQIAGRAGRSIEFPKGIIYFLVEHYTVEIHLAQKQITKMNKLAKKLLD